MIVIARRYGQLGNRLWLYAHMIAAAAEYGVTVANPSFAEYAELFPSTRHDLWCRYPIVSQPTVDTRGPSRRTRDWLAQGVYLSAKTLYTLRLRNYPAHVLRIKGEQSCDLGSDAFRELATSGRPVMTLGWQFRCESLLVKHAAIVRHHFQLAPEHGEPVGECLYQARQSGDVVIGIHIRQGDYRTFLGGRYYYEVRDYVATMREVQAQLAPRRVTFLVCTNVPYDQSDFAGLNVQFGPGVPVQDMYALAETDMIIGPPSTFTMWASFYGGAPLAMMKRCDAKIEVESVAPELFKSNPISTKYQIVQGKLSELSASELADVFGLNPPNERLQREVKSNS
ncbi:hypothetical protein RMSM_07346 [Rhodopirellula maiorica SM1]|uniref:Glycosyl transferase family 11 n=1 Tax=Rhodopirellula maiorica SM1 TaxID=1265738 RepID=M5RP46_9BACT|nr:hypothetical protein [Rhodopirellula maiorica]EMI15734.1 hypothetical protein RMSM_07346 [Rhodopirellula maiorica SM1]